MKYYRNPTRDETLRVYALRLNDNLPRSEVWFWKFWSSSGMTHERDKPNVPIGRFICDVYNDKWNYVIEVDGKSHEAITQEMDDVHKDKLLSSLGLKVFRVKAYDHQGLCDLISKIKEVRQENCKKVNIKTALKKVDIERRRTSILKSTKKRKKKVYTLENKKWYIANERLKTFKEYLNKQT